MTTNPRRIPGAKNSAASSREADHIVNTAMSSNGEGTGNGVSGHLLGLFAALRVRRAKKRAIAAWEAQRRDLQS